jgi:nucleotide-binding universal stress UspA family protein
MPGIVVGVDGSDHSRRALGWAMREAVKHELPLTVVSVHPPPARPATRIYWGVHTAPDSSIDLEPAQVAVQEFVGKVAGEIGETPPGITVSVTMGDVAEELILASHDAYMLVVGPAAAAGSPGS